MLRKLRIALATIFFVGLVLLFVGVCTDWLGWMASLQFLPSLLAGNLIVIIAVLLLTLVLGRLYCSVICPMGVTQDIIIFLRRQYGKMMTRCQ
ncbi:MAG: 4Fe-4S binding protein, partial [Bacteroidales bacterium]|nr:4Fe-4S binding protein [Bacteroidales bacterium]